MSNQVVQRASCDPHHWVSKHQPGLPIYWVRQCSLCGDFDGDDMRREMDKVDDARSRLAAVLLRLADVEALCKGWEDDEWDVFPADLRAALDSEPAPPTNGSDQ